MGLRRVLHLCIVVLFSWVLMGVAWGSVTFEWSRRFDGSAHGPDEPVGVALDGSGNVFITGTYTRAGGETGIATIKYDADGKFLWLKRSAAAKPATAAGLALDASGNVLVTGESDGAMLTIKYDTDGNELWSRRYRTGEGYRDAARTIGVWSDGSVFVAGDSTPPGGASDFLIVKYDAEGAVLWFNRYAGPAGKADEMKAMAVDNLGNVCMAGRSQDSNGVYELTTVKIDRYGEEFWVDRYRSDGSTLDEAEAITVDVDRNVYVAGSTTGENGADILVMKIGNYGERLWTARYDGPAHGDDRAKGIALGPMGELYVVGWSYDAATGNDLTTLRYDAVGQCWWTSRHHAAAADNDGVAAVTVDVFGQVVVAGSAARGDGGENGFVTLGLGTNGEIKWTRCLDAGAGSDSRPVGLAVDGSTNVFVTGTSRRSEAARDFLTAKYAQAPLWERIPFGATEPDNAVIAVDSSGNPHVCYNESPEGDRILRYARYDGTRWEKHIVNLRSYSPSGMVIDSLDRAHIVYVAEGELKHVLFDGTEWSVSTAGDSASSVSLAVDGSNRPHISYVTRTDNGEYELTYAHHDGLQWVTERNLVGGVSSWHGTSIALTASGKAHIMVPGAVSPYPLYWVTNESGAWRVTPIDEGLLPSLTLDNAGHPHVSFINLKKGLIYARHNGKRWLKTLVLVDLGITSGPLSDSKLYRDQAGGMHMIFTRGGIDGGPFLLHSRKTSSGWVYDIVDRGVDQASSGGSGKDVLVAYIKQMDDDGEWYELVVSRGARGNIP